MRAEVAEDTALDYVLELVPVLGLKEGGLMEMDLAVGRLREHAIEYDDVEVEVGVESCTESMKEAECPELSVAGCTRARAAQGGANGTDEDPQDGARDVWVVVQEGTQPLRKAQHPLADGKVRQHSDR